MTKDVFISYSSKEYEKIAPIKTLLDNNNISYWMAPEAIPAGSNYAKEIPSAIKECKVFLLILSPNTQESKWVPAEIEMAVNLGKTIIPFTIEQCELKDEFNFMLSRSQRIDAYRDFHEASQKLIDILCEHFRHKSSKHKPKTIHTNSGRRLLGVAIVCTLVVILSCIVATLILTPTSDTTSQSKLMKFISSLNKQSGNHSAYVEGKPTFVESIENYKEFLGKTKFETLAEYNNAKYSSTHSEKDFFEIYTNTFLMFRTYDNLFAGVQIPFLDLFPEAQTHILDVGLLSQQTFDNILKIETTLTSMAIDTDTPRLNGKMC